MVLAGVSHRPRHDGLSIIIGDMKSPGVTVRPIPNIVGYKYFNEIFFSDVEVPEENLVGRENNGWAQLMQALSFERGLALGFSGKLRRAFDELHMFVKAEGLMGNPAVREKLSELLLDVKTLRIMAYESAWKEHSGQKVIYEPSRDKAYNDDLFEKFGRLGTEILGARSQVDPLHLNSRWSRVKSIIEGISWGGPAFATAAGTTDNMRNIVAQFALGLPKGY